MDSTLGARAFDPLLQRAGVSFFPRSENTGPKPSGSNGIHFVAIRWSTVGSVL